MAAVPERHPPHRRRRASRSDSMSVRMSPVKLSRQEPLINSKGRRNRDRWRYAGNLES